MTDHEADAYATRTMGAEAIQQAIYEMRDDHTNRRTRQRRLKAVVWFGSSVAAEWFRQMGTPLVEVLVALDWVAHACDVLENSGNIPIQESEWVLLFRGVAAIWDAPHVFPSREFPVPRPSYARPWRNNL